MSLTIELDEARAEQLERLKQRTGADAEAVLSEALEAYEATLDQVELPPFTAEQEARIEAGLEDVRAGRTYSHEEVFAEVRERLRR